MTCDPIWTPSIQSINNSRMAQFMRQVNQSYQTKLNTYHQLHQWSVEETSAFWQELADFLSFHWQVEPSNAFTPGDNIKTAKWFTGGRFNFAENLLRHNSDAPAITCVDEQGNRHTISWHKLKQQVAACAAGLKAAGVQKGDRVVGVLPNNHYPIIAMLATASLGAIWACCSPDFGAQAIVDRLGQIEPKVCFIVDGHFYHGKSHSAFDKIKFIRQSLPAIQRFILCPQIENGLPLDEGMIVWETFLDNQAVLDFVSLPFDHPLYILFSSGTTGMPKCMVHSAGGTLIQHMKEQALHCDIRAGDNLCFYTTTGWMMWNWMVSALSLGCQITLYEGSPAFPSPKHLFDIINQFGVTHFGTGAKFISSCQKVELSIKHDLPLSKLRMILSTGSPLLPKNFDYVYESLKEDIPLCSISGGSDIIGCFALGNPMLPVYRGELQCIGLGMDVAVFNEQGQAVSQEKGELVCRNAHPSMPIGFWQDTDGSRYDNAYFSRFQGVWAHGDYAEITAHDGVIIYGRADATLNPGGVRIGTAEIYRQLEKLPDIVDSVVVGQPWQDDERIVLFVQMQAGTSLSESRIHEIKQYIRENTSPRHVPAIIKQVSAIPRTLSGKVVELAVKQVLMGQNVNNLQAIANPECLAEFNL
ncbi:acetoacetate--CoA ligase [Legionella sp. W05-934-2]|uniref:acetoacetate--CoA ligase n=1 Tax=Legionella sp. W05-934-2 TaxID=1198649 RepID=UPI00346381C7